MRAHKHTYSYRYETHVKKKVKKESVWHIGLLDNEASVINKKKMFWKILRKFMNFEYGAFNRHALHSRM